FTRSARRLTKINIMQYLKDYKPTIDSVPRARILLIGAVGAGKSSFFNSINSIFRGNITSQANAGYQETSLTLQVMLHCKKKSGYSIHFIFKVTRKTFLLLFLDVPVMALLTKVDKVCPHVEKDLKNVYYKLHVSLQIKKASGCLGIAESNVLPVKNYSSETELNDTSDILLLSAMKQMLNFSDNYIDNFDKDTH
uniref:Interferon-induced protein 44-like n=1 Tax=Paramormyrops kingsleyae TaxID=1676925 RepID=A0A3B3QYE2_9TELE